MAWSTSDYLLAAIFDSSEMGNWQRGGGKGQKPQPLPRPGSKHKTYGKAIPIEQGRELLRRRKEGQSAA